MILSALPERQWAMPAAQWAVGRQSNRIGQWDGGGRMDGTMGSGRSPLMQKQQWRRETIAANTEAAQWEFGILDFCFFVLGHS
jgi:hypothetical protein